MDLHSEALLMEYKANLDDYVLLKEVVLKTLNGFVDSLGILVNSVTARIKTEDSLKGKLNAKGYKYPTIIDVTDIVGARIVTFYSDQIEQFAALIEKTFEIDWDNSIDKRKIDNIDQFGYMSLHFICKVPKSLYNNPDHPNVNNIPFEIQIRTVLQHTWATIYHDTGYKSDVEVPKKYLRSLNRLAGLLEIADESFLEIRNEIDDYRRRVKQIVKNGDLGAVGFDGDTFHAYCRNGGFDSLNKSIAEINNMEIEEVSLREFLPIFSLLQFQTLKDFDDFIKTYSPKAYKLCVYQFQGKDIDIITSAAAPTALCEVCVLEKGTKEDLIQLLNMIFGPRKSNERMANNLYEMGKKMGIVKER